MFGGTRRQAPEPLRHRLARSPTSTQGCFTTSAMQSVVYASRCPENYQYSSQSPHMFASLKASFADRNEIWPPWTSAWWSRLMGDPVDLVALLRIVERYVHGASDAGA